MVRWLLALLTLGLFAVACSAKSSGSSDALRFKVEHHCNKFNNKYAAEQEFQHPDKPCVLCKCCKTGKVTCKKRPCPPGLDTKCGNKRLSVLAADECCVECDQQCKIEHKNASCNDDSSCPGALVFGENDCCGTCGCLTSRGELLEPTPPDTYVDTPTHPACEQCTCINGKFDCKSEAPCPDERLKCVDGRVDPTTCKWHCPNGEGNTCYDGREMIVMSASEPVVQRGERMCWCHFKDGVFLAEAVCAPKGHMGKIERALKDQMCMKEPMDPSLWGSG